MRVALPRPRGARLTQLRASPAANASTISTTPAAMAVWACSVEAPMWWVATTCGWRASGESHSAVPRARLVGEHVEACADAARIERREQRRLVDHVTA